MGWPDGSFFIRKTSSLPRGSSVLIHNPTSIILGGRRGREGTDVRMAERLLPHLFFQLLLCLALNTKGGDRACF